MTLTPKQRRKLLIESGRKGGRAKVPKGFAKMDPERAFELQSKGGQNSKRRKKGEQ